MTQVGVWTELRLGGSSAETSPSARLLAGIGSKPSGEAHASPKLSSAYFPWETPSRGEAGFRSSVERNCATPLLAHRIYLDTAFGLAAEVNETSPDGTMAGPFSFGAFPVTTSSPLLLHHLVPHEHWYFTPTPAPRVPTVTRFPSQRPRRPREQWFMIALIVAALAALGVALISQFGWSHMQDQLAQLNPAIAILAMAVLPLFGFSVAVVYVVAGAKFGFWMGGLIITGITVVHLVASHAIARSFLRAPLQRLLARRKHHLPEFPPSESRSIALMASLVPGPPYFVRNYLLALTNIPLRTYFWICLPVYVVRSYVTLSLGDLSHDMSGEKLALLLAVYLVKLAICGYLLQRLRQRLKGTHPTG